MLMNKLHPVGFIVHISKYVNFQRLVWISQHSYNVMSWLHCWHVHT